MMPWDIPGYAKGAKSFYPKRERGTSGETVAHPATMQLRGREEGVEIERGEGGRNCCTPCNIAVEGEGGRSGD